MKMFWLKLSVWISSYFVVSCGSTTSVTESYRIRMYGTQTTPEGATGSNSPVSMVFEIAEAKLTLKDGTPVYILPQGETKEVTIINRPQEVLLLSDLKEYRDKEFSTVSIIFSKTLVTNGKNATAYESDFDDNRLEVVDSFTLKKNDKKVMTIRAQWGKTITYNDDESEIERAVNPKLEATAGE